MRVMDVLKGVHLAPYFFLHDFCRKAKLPGMERCHVRLFVLVPEYIPGGSCRYRHNWLFVAILLLIRIEGYLLYGVNFSSLTLQNRVKSNFEERLGVRMPTICKEGANCCTSGSSNKGSARSVSRRLQKSRDGTTTTSSGVPWEGQITWIVASCSTQTAIDKSIANG
jgi:hypothetical protein